MTDQPFDVQLHQRFAVDGVELAWQRWGPERGTELVLCHGYSGSSHDFATVFEPLSADRPVIALDHRGHGDSTKLGRTDGYAIAGLADDFAAFLAATVAGPVDLLGHSMGGRVALLTTLDHPELVRSLILMDTSAWSFRTPDAAVAAIVEGFLADFDPAAGLPDPTLMVGPDAALVAAATPTWWQERRVEQWEAFDPYALKALGMELFAADAPSVRSRLGELEIPVTVIAGSNDHPFADQAPELAAETSARALAVIDGAFHSPQLTHRADWLAAVSGHLAAAG